MQILICRFVIVIAIGIAVADNLHVFGIPLGYSLPAGLIAGVVMGTFVVDLIMIPFIMRAVLRKIRTQPSSDPAEFDHYLAAIEERGLKAPVVFPVAAPLGNRYGWYMPVLEGEILVVHTGWAWTRHRALRQADRRFESVQQEAH